VDNTGLTGTYDLYLRWMPDNDDAVSNPKDAGADTTLPNLFTAVQEQLGLKLVPSRGPVSVLVVDSVQLVSRYFCSGLLLPLSIDGEFRKDIGFGSSQEKFRNVTPSGTRCAASATRFSAKTQASDPPERVSTRPNGPLLTDS
jgi:hypothetical protein